MAFAGRLKELRRHAGLTQLAVVQALPDHGGYLVSDAACSLWEQASSAPDAINAAALERLFGEPEGALGALLGYRGDDPSTAERLNRLEARFDQLEAKIERLLRRKR